MFDKQTARQEIEQILDGGDIGEIKALLTFDSADSDDEVILKFNLWSRFFLPHYFQKKGADPPEYYSDAEFHKEIDKYNLKCYREPFTFVDIVFRDGGKTARTKLFLAFAISNDLTRFRRYIKILSADLVNSKQIVTDIYNIFTLPKIKIIYPEILQKTDAKREETMSSFTTATGIKVSADTVGVAQRGALQEDARPDIILFDDFENSKTLRSAVQTHAIWDNMEEARISLAVNGSCVYCCNYISESGNVHKLAAKKQDSKKILIVPIISADGVLAWPEKHAMESIEQMKKTDENFEGERMCRPSASKNVFFDRERLEQQVPKNPVKVLNGFKIFSEFNPSHEYGSGHDVAGGVGLDSSTSVFIDFTCYPAEIVGTYQNNLIKPDVFGYEVRNQHELFGNCLVAPERNNHGYTTVTILRQLGVRIMETPRKETTVDRQEPVEYGWETNPLTKPKMMFALAKAISDGLLILNDVDLINELKSYTRDNLLESVKDPRLVTRHWDLLIACAIAWQLKDVQKTSIQARTVQAQIVMANRQKFKGFQ